MSKIDVDFIIDLRALILETFEHTPAAPAHAPHAIAGKPPDRAWLENFLVKILDDHRHPVWQHIERYTSAHWQIGQYDGIVTGLTRAAEVLRTRAGQHYADNQDDLARALRGGAETVDKEALKAATDTANAKKARGYGP
jgi:hypothetical protein